MSEVKQAKVESVQSLGTKGAYYTYEIILDDGVTAQLFKKTNNPWVEKGQTIDYVLRPSRDGELPGINIKNKVGSDAYSGGAPAYSNGDKDAKINKSWAIKTAALAYAGHWNNDGPTKSPEAICTDVLSLAKLYKAALDTWLAE